MKRLCSCGLIKHEGPPSPQAAAAMQAHCGSEGERKRLALNSHCAGLQVVDLDGQILEKPADAAHACQMLQALAGKEHQVHTGAFRSALLRCVVRSTPCCPENRTPMRQL